MNTTQQVADGFQAVAEQLTALARADADYSAQVCAMRHGQTVIDLAVGPDLRPDSLIGVFSSSKGIAAMCVALLIESGDLDLDTTMSHYWPEFAAAGKGEVTVRTTLSHRAGLVGFQGGFTTAELAEHHELAARLAAMRPLWVPGTAHGYHGITIGIMISELVQRITGTDFADFYRTRLRDPLGADFHFGVRQEHLPRIVNVRPPRLPADIDPELAEAMEPEPNSLLGLAINLCDRFPPVHLQADDAVIRSSGPAAIGGVGNARGLARLYAECLDHPSALGLFSPRTIRSVSQIHSVGIDLVLGLHTQFGIVFQTSDARLRYGSAWAFGHDGAGGSIGFADPATGVSFGYTTSRMPLPGGADPRGIDLARIVSRCVRELS